LDFNFSHILLLIFRW